MKLSDNAKSYIAYVKKSSAASCDQCTDCARQVIDLLGKGSATGRGDDVQQYLLSNLKNAVSIQDGLYNLTISIGDGQIWQHGLVLQKSGYDLFIYQGWVSHYTLGQWLDATGGDQPQNHKTSFRMFSPGSAEFTVPDSMIQWLSGLYDLKTWYDGKRPQSGFEDLLCLLFGVTTSSKEQAVTKLVYGKYPLTFSWRYAMLKALDDLP